MLMAMEKYFSVVNNIAIVCKERCIPTKSVTYLSANRLGALAEHIKVIAAVRHGASEQEAYRVVCISCAPHPRRELVDTVGVMAEEIEAEIDGNLLQASQLDDDDVIPVVGQYENLSHHVMKVLKKRESSRSSHESKNIRIATCNRY